MSKARKAGRRGDNCPQPSPGFVRGTFAEVASLVDGRTLGVDPPYLPTDVNIAVNDMVVDTLKLLAPVMPKLARVGPDGLEQLVGLTFYAASQGFAMALYRYADELKRVPELKKWHSRRDDGINKGHATQSQAREARYQRIRDKWAAMEKAGERVTNETVAAAIRQDGEEKCSARTVQRAFATLTAKAKPVKRKKR